MNESFDPAVAFKTLNRLRVAYLLVGGLAGEVHGAEVGLQVIEVCYECSPPNARRLAEALRELNAQPRNGETFKAPLAADEIVAGGSFKVRTDAGPMDLMATPEGTHGYRDLKKRGCRYDLGDGLVIRVAALGDLIRIEKAAHGRNERPQLQLLTELQRQLDRDE